MNGDITCLHKVLILAVCAALVGCGSGGTQSGSSSPATYAVGGTVSGLLGAGLVLQDNGGNNLPINANGSFTFTTAITSGAAYSVTVLTQPSGPAQTCAMINGGGTASANVTNIQVTCTTNTYTIGGIVSGLLGTGLVLQDNGGNNLTVNAGATSFTFTTAIASGGSYNITVFSQPSSPSQSCAVTSGGSGTATNANITNAVVTCTTTPVSFGKWSGTIQSSGSVNNIFPLDFSAELTGTSLSTLNYPPSSIDPPSTSCSTLHIGSLGSIIDRNIWTLPQPLGPASLSGTGNGSVVSLTVQTPVTGSSYSPETLSLIGSLTVNGTILSGTYQNTGFQAGCLYSGSAGTFSFTNYAQLTTASGTFNYGTLGPVPLSISFNEDALGKINGGISIGAIPSLCGSPTLVIMTGWTVGRFFYMYSNIVTKPGLAVWGIMNDAGGTTVTIYSQQLGQLDPCVDALSTSNPSGGIILTKP